MLNISCDSSSLKTNKGQHVCIKVYFTDLGNVLDSDIDF